MRYVRKRNGRLQEFDEGRIKKAVLQAILAVGGEDGERQAAEITESVVKQLEETFGSEGVPTVEEIQDVVEKTLIGEGMARTAKAYILYRKQHQDLRELATILSQDDLIDKYIMKADWRVRENSNMNFSLQGLNNYLSSNIISKYWLNRVYPSNIRRAHSSGEIHIHDLAVLGPYCVGWDLPDLLLSGFKGVVGKVESSPAKHLSSALGQVVNFFYTLQGEAAGAQAFSNFDTLLAPFVRYDNLDYRGVKQAMQEFVFGLNVPTRVGFQTPFTNLSMDLNVPKHMADEAVIIGGVPQDATYGEFQAEMDMFNKAYCEVMMEGDGAGRSFSFPIPTINITDDFPWESEVADSIMEMTRKFGTPYFANFVNSDMSPEDVRSMCCRLRLDNRELRKRGGGLFGANPLTGSINVVTLNMARLGYLSKDEMEFKKRVRDLMEYAKEICEVKRDILERYMDAGLYPYSRFYLQGVKDGTGEYFKNHFSTIGLNGMNEACVNLLGKDITTEEGRDFAVEIMELSLIHI